MKHLPILICCTAVMLTALVSWRIPADESQTWPTHSPATADQAWAEAILSSLSMSDKKSRDSNRSFSDALKLAARKAPIYVSMADIGNGVADFKQVTTPGMQKVESTTDSGELTDFAEEMIKAMHQKGSELLAAYHAAIAEDPDCREAWFQLALSEDRELAERASAELIRIDPDNAIPYYIKAMLEADVQNLEGMTTAILQGNQATQRRLYEPLLPTHFDLRYPSTSEYRDLGVAGKKVSPQALAYLVSINQQFRFIAPTLQSRLRSALQRIPHENGTWTLSANPKEAEEQLIAIRDMGLRLTTEESRDILVMLTGLAVANTTNQQLCDFYRSSNQPEKFEVVEAVSARLLQFRQSVAADLKREALPNDELRQALLGRIGVRARKRARLDVLIRQAGLQ